ELPGWAWPPRLESDQAVPEAAHLVGILSDAPFGATTIVRDPGASAAPLAVAPVEDDGHPVVARKRLAEVLVPTRLVAIDDEQKCRASSDAHGSADCSESARRCVLETLTPSHASCGLGCRHFRHRPFIAFQLHLLRMFPTSR